MMEFVGKNYGADQLQSKLCKYAVGVVDKGTKTIRLYEAPAFALKQVLLYRCLSATPPGYCASALR